MPIPGAPSPASPAEALAWLVSRVPLTGDQLAQVTTQVAAKAFTVAGLAQASLVADTLAALERAVSQGTAFTDFQAAVGARLTSAWGKDGGRLSTVFRTGVQSAYGAGRYAQATDPDVAATRPYWRYLAIIDKRTTGVCRASNGVVLPSDDPWWETHVPPLHFGCRCSLQTLTERGASRYGGVRPPASDVPPAPGFGSPPEL